MNGSRITWCGWHRRERISGSGFPVVEELNASELPFMKRFLWDNGIRDIELLAYHRMGVGKGDLLLEPIVQESFPGAGSGRNGRV